MMRTKLTITVFASICFGCGGEPGGGADAGGSSEPIEDCIVGAWVSHVFDCVICDGSGTDTPECDAGDCQFTRALVLLEDGRGVEPRVTYSATLGHLSAVGGALAVETTAQTWRSESGAVLVQERDGSVGELVVHCDPDRLDLEGRTTYDRAPPGLSEGLLDAAVTGEWTMVSYSP